MSNSVITHFRAWLRRVWDKCAILWLILIVSCAPPALTPLSVRAANIDPRLKWVRVTSANTYPKYIVTDIGYQDEIQSGGNVNIYVSVLDETGKPAFGTRVNFNTSDLQNPATQTVINGGTDFPMSGDSSFAPDRGESGPYFVEIAGAASDRVSGMGLPLRRHVVYQIRFQRVMVGVTPTPSPLTPTPTPTPTSPQSGVTEQRVRDLINEALDRAKFR